MDPRELAIIRHAVGWESTDRGYRNHFTADMSGGDKRLIEEMVRVGYMHSVGVSGQVCLYRVTLSGALAAGVVEWARTKPKTWRKKGRRK